MRPEALKGHLDTLILATLQDEPLHGYALAQELRRRSVGAFDLPEGTIYPALHRLERAGLLSSRWAADAPRRRRVYSLTRKGSDQLAIGRMEWLHFAGGMQAVLG